MSDQESYFGFEEMFISTTDLRGIISSGNDVFVRVSGFPKEKLLKAPHNIIRHPDMPKVVFKLLWDTIQAGKPISAYVKNRSIDGKYYWVVANVLPAQEGYLSVRFKPSSAIFELIPKLYSQMLEIEKQKGMEGSGAFLFEQLSKLGFKSYEDFMGKMLEEELKAREIKISEIESTVEKNKTKATSESAGYVVEMNRVSQLSSKSLKNVFSSMDSFNQIQLAMQKSSSIIEACEKLEYLSLNMSVMANKLGKEGPSLSVISAAFQKSSREVSERFKKFSLSVEEMVKMFNRIKFDICFSRVYVDMIAFFTQEALASAHFEKELPETMKNFVQIINTVQGYFGKTIELQGDALQSMKEFKLLTEMLKSVVMSLDLIRMGGRLEGSRTIKTEEVFAPYVEEMMTTIQSIEVPVSEVSEIVNQMITLLEDIRTQLNQIGIQMIEIDLIRYRDFKTVAQSII